MKEKSGILGDESSGCALRNDSRGFSRSRVGARLLASHPQEVDMRVSTLALAVILASPSGFSWAQTASEGEKAAPQEPAASNSQTPIASPYSFNRVDNGFIRLDSPNGEIAYCSAQTSGWICQAVPIDKASSAASNEDAQKGITFLKGLEEKLGRLQD